MDLERGDGRPYFLWDEDITTDQLRAVLAGPDSPERDRRLGKMLREARDIDVWCFVTPAEVAAALPRLRVASAVAAPSGRSSSSRVGEKMAFSPPKGSLRPFQAEVLSGFFERERGFYLTGGAALAGFYLGHRTTSDLDLFTSDAAAFERGRFALTDTAASLRAHLDIIQEAPGFHRSVLTRGDEGVVVDLVREQVYQIHVDKPERAGIRADPPDEILANKLAALVGRAEERDLIDVWFLERAGYRIESALAAALAKDGGCTPAVLAWLLSRVEIPDQARLPGGVGAG